MRESFEAVRAKGECAVIPYVCAGDPSLEATAAALKAIDSNGADIIELGVPYSDPLADGPVIQAAATRALAGGAKLQGVLDMLAGVSDELTSPVVLFTYYNPIIAFGLEEFMAAARKAGAAGLLVPDLPLEETENIRMAAAAAGLEMVLLVTPTTPKERMAAIAEKSDGFVYLVSVAGVTGTRTKVAEGVEDLIATLKSVTDKPVAVGFGISGGEQAAKVRGWGADGVIAGSAFVRALGEAEGGAEEGVAKAGQLAREIKDAVLALDSVAS